MINDHTGAKVYITKSTDHQGNRLVEFVGDKKQIVDALQELLTFLTEKAPGSNLMMNPLYYA